MLRIGIVTDRQPAKGRVKVAFEEDGIVTQWIPVLQRGSASNKYFSLPDINDQVAVQMQDADFGVVLGAMYNDEDAVPTGATGDTEMVTFSDGVTVKYDRAAKRLTVSGQPAIDVFADTVYVNANTVLIESGGTEHTGDVLINGQLTVTGGMNAGGNLQVSGDVVASGEVTAQDGAGSVSLSTHTHISAGPGSPTAPPTPGT